MANAEKNAARAAAMKVKREEKKKQAEADAKLPPRKRVRKAQLSVLNKVEKILNGNCNSATKGNYNCAKFVLDWSGVSDIRTPLAQPLKQKSLASTLLKRLKKVASEKQRKDGQAETPK
jgi:hypothetical protein